MKFEVNIREIVGKGGDFSHVLGKVSEQLRPEFEKVVKEYFNREELAKAKERVFNGAYTSDDLVTLQRNLNECKREEAAFQVEKDIEVRKQAMAVTRQPDPTVVEKDEFQGIMNALGMANVVHKGQWR